MKNCPDKETLEKFADYGLTEAMNKNILAHLSLCDSCREKVWCLLSEEQSLLRSLSAETSAQNKTPIKNLTEKCLSKTLLLVYAGKCLKEDQLKLVESHLEKCDNCVLELTKIQRSMNSPADLEIDMSVLEGSALYGLKSNILEIALKAKDNFLELIRHTGEQLAWTPQFGAVRGAEEKKEKPIVIRKDFSERDLSVEVRIKGELTDSEATLSVSLMKLSKEEFISGQNVEISSGEMHHHVKTNEDGIAAFYCNKNRTYAIKVTGEIVVIITVK